jgi:hypothetical protein
MTMGVASKENQLRPEVSAKQQSNNQITGKLNLLTSQTHCRLQALEALREKLKSRYKR